MLLKRLQLLAEYFYPESQCGFRANRSTTDMIFSLPQLQGKCREQRQRLFTAFMMIKAFNLVSRSGLFTLLQRIGCPPKLLKMISSFLGNMQGTVQYDDSSSDLFPINSGIKQGCVLHSLASSSRSCSSMHLTHILEEVHLSDRSTLS